MRKLARNEVADLTPLKLAFVLDMLVRFYDTGEHSVAPEELIESVGERVRSINEEGFYSINGRNSDVEYQRIEETDFIRESAYDPRVRFNFQSFRAMNVMLIDATLRYEYSGDELFHYLFETLSPSALGESSDA